MTRGVENTLLAHGGTEDIDIPYPTLTKLVNDAHHVDVDALLDSKNAQIAALEEANKALADERDFYKQRAHELEDRAMGKVYD